MYVLPYKVASKSAKSLAHELNAVLLGEFITLVKGDPSIPIVNWGCGEPSIPHLDKCCIANKPSAVLSAVNKHATFLLLSSANVRVPAFTTSASEAQGWAFNGKVVARTKVESKDGDGLIVVQQGEDIPVAKLYSKFIPAKDEFRVSVCKKSDGTYTAFAVQKKVPIKPGSTPDVKTTKGGYGLSLLEEAYIPTGIRPIARDAIKALGLDFGGVDVILGKDGNAYILEVNTAPELTDTLVKRYAKHLNALLG